jgi:hypothetical protein
MQVLEILLVRYIFGIPRALWSDKGVEMAHTKPEFWRESLPWAKTMCLFGGNLLWTPQFVGIACGSIRRAVCRIWHASGLKQLYNGIQLVWRDRTPNSIRSTRGHITPEEVNVWNFRFLGVNVCFFLYPKPYETARWTKRSASSKRKLLFVWSTCRCFLPSPSDFQFGPCNLHLIKWCKMPKREANGLLQFPHGWIAGICNFSELCLAAVLKGLHWVWFLVRLLLARGTPQKIETKILTILGPSIGFLCGLLWPRIF